MRVVEIQCSIESLGKWFLGGVHPCLNLMPPRVMTEISSSVLPNRLYSIGRVMIYDIFSCEILSV